MLNCCRHLPVWMLVCTLYIYPQFSVASIQNALISVESPYNMEDTISSIKKSLAHNNFRLLREQNIDEGVTDKVNPNYRILYFCNFSLAYKAIQKEKKIGFMLPCRLTITKVNNKVYIHYVNPLFAKKMVGKNLADLCDQISLAFNNIIEEVVL